MNRRSFISSMPFLGGLVSRQSVGSHPATVELRQLENGVITLEQIRKARGMEWREVLKQKAKENAETLRLAKLL